MRCDSKDGQQRFVPADKACSCGLDVCVHSQTHMYEGERFTVYIVPLEQCMMCCDECRLMQLLDKPVMSQHTAWATTCALRLRLQARMRARPVKVKGREGKQMLYCTKYGLDDMSACFHFQILCCIDQMASIQFGLLDGWVLFCSQHYIDLTAAYLDCAL